jgi:hypothetical protein
MRTNNALQVIFAFFLGLVVVAFVGIGVNTFYPEPEWGSDASRQAYSDWQLTTGIVLLVCATLLLVISLLLAEDKGVLSNGLLLGGVFTMVYAVGVTISTDRSVVRFLVVGAALVVTIGVGYLTFVRGRRRRTGQPSAGIPEGSAAVPAAATGPGAPAAPFGPTDADLAGRLAVVERKLDALARVLGS